MQKVIKITATWEMKGQSDTWDGECVLNDNGWFEGIAFDINSLTYRGERLIFGIYLPDQQINFFKLTPFQVSVPLIFRAKGNDESMEGSFSRMIMFGEEKQGTVSIVIQEGEDTLENVSRMVEEYKEKMDEYNRAIYEINLQNKETWFEVLNEEK